MYVYVLVVYLFSADSLTVISSDMYTEDHNECIRVATEIMEDYFEGLHPINAACLPYRENKLQLMQYMKQGENS